MMRLLGTTCTGNGQHSHVYPVCYLCSVDDVICNLDNILLRFYKDIPSPSTPTPPPPSPLSAIVARLLLSHSFLFSSQPLTHFQASFPMLYCSFLLHFNLNSSLIPLTLYDPGAFKAPPPPLDFLLSRI